MLLRYGFEISINFKNDIISIKKQCKIINQLNKRNFYQINKMNLTYEEKNFNNEQENINNENMKRNKLNIKNINNKKYITDNKNKSIK